VNGTQVGDHRGGYDPFTFDVTGSLKPSGEQEIILSAWDPTDAGAIPRGKQVLKPSGIMYTAVSGIWQSVWLEPVPQTSIRSLKITPKVELLRHAQDRDQEGPGRGEPHVPQWQGDFPDGAAVYTQTTDCEGEVNGLLTYDRAVNKIGTDAIARINLPVYDVKTDLDAEIPPVDMPPASPRPRPKTNPVSTSGGGGQTP